MANSEKARSKTQSRPRNTGIILFFDFVKNFGIIIDKSNTKYNAHSASFELQKNCAHVNQCIYAGKPVSFETANTRNGLEAIRVREPYDDSVPALYLDDNKNGAQLRSLCHRWTEGSRCFNNLETMSAPEYRKKTRLYFKDFNSNTDDDCCDFRNSKIHAWMQLNREHLHITEYKRNYDRNDYKNELNKIFSDEKESDHENGLMNNLVDRSADYLEIQHRFTVSSNRRSK